MNKKIDIVIANKTDAVGLAGVMGGLSTEVEEDTKNILIEAAIFDSVKIRKTSKKILRSEASNRFEKGLDPKRTYLAIARSCHLLEKYADAEVVGGLSVYDNTDKSDKNIRITVEKINKVLGIEIPEEICVSILNDLGFEVSANNGCLDVVVPTRRMDVNIPEDLVEEVGRIYGMDNIKGKLPELNVVTGSYDKTKREIKNKMVAMGLNETCSYSLIPAGEVHKFTTDSFEEIYLADPMSEDRNTLRYSLLYSLKEIYLYNKARNNTNISIFEVGKGFYKEDGIYKEDLKLAGLMTGDYYLDINNSKVDFYTVKGVVEELLEYLGFGGRYSFVVGGTPEELHPGQSASIILQGKPIGVIGKLHPNVLKDNVYVFEINLDKLLANFPSRMSYKDIPKFPSISKDIAFILKKDVTAGEVMATIKKAGGKLLQSISVFDVYTGENVGEDEKSIAFKLNFMDPTRTLTDEEVMNVFNTIIGKVEGAHNAKLRDK